MFDPENRATPTARTLAQTSLTRLYPSCFIPRPWRLRQPFFAFHSPHRAIATSNDGISLLPDIPSRWRVRSPADMKTMKKGLGMNRMLGGLKRRTTGMFTLPLPPPSTLRWRLPVVERPNADSNFRIRVLVRGKHTAAREPEPRGGGCHRSGTSPRLHLPRLGSPSRRDVR